MVARVTLRALAMHLQPFWLHQKPLNWLRFQSPPLSSPPQVLILSHLCFVAVMGRNTVEVEESGVEEGTACWLCGSVFPSSVGLGMTLPIGVENTERRLREADSEGRRGEEEKGLGFGRIPPRTHQGSQQRPVVKSIK